MTSQRPCYRRYGGEQEVSAEAGVNIPYDVYTQSWTGHTRLLMSDFISSTVALQANTVVL
jgi:hypothetical protein